MILRSQIIGAIEAACGDVDARRRLGALPGQRRAAGWAESTRYPGAARESGRCPARHLVLSEGDLGPCDERGATRPPAVQAVAVCHPHRLAFDLVPHRAAEA